MKRMLIFAAAIGLASIASAETCVDPETGLTWTYRVVGGVAEIYNDDAHAVSPDPSGDLVVPPTLHGYTVTSIGDRAIASMGNVTSVTLPSSVTNVGRAAFYHCFRMESISMPGVKTIGFEAFRECVALASVTMPTDVGFTGKRAFAQCENLVDENGLVVIDGVLCGNGTGFSWEHFVVPDYVTRIADYAFAEQGITNVTISGCVKSIGNFAFYGAWIENLVIENGVEEIGTAAFKDCGLLKSVTIPGSVKRIGSSAFYNSLKLRRVTIMSGVETIGSSAFRYCDLGHMSIPKTVTTIETSALPAKNSTWRVYVEAGDTDRVKGLLNLTGSSLAAIDWVEPSGAYSLTFSGNGGKLTSQTIPIKRGEAIGDLPCATRSEYKFAGWWTSASGGTQISAETVPTGNATYYAHWTAAPVPKVTVTFDKNGGDTVEFGQATRISGNHIGTMPSVTRSGYTFSAWWTTADSSGSRVTRTTSVPETDVTYYAHWIKDIAPTCTVTFNVNGGDSVTEPSRVVDNGAAVGTPLPTATREGYSCDGWFTEASGGTQINGTETVTADITYYAHWTELPPGYNTETVNGVQWTYRVVGDAAEIYNDDNAAIPTTTAGAIDVPATLGGYPVTSIGDAAFGHCPLLTRVKIPSGVTSIGNNVFHSDEALRDIFIPKTVTELGSNMFIAHSVKTIHVEEGDIDRVSTMVSAVIGSTFNYVVGFPANDDFADATVISGLSGSVNARNVGASTEADEPLVTHFTDIYPGVTIWWTWTAPSDGRVTFNTVGSSVDTLLGVYTGNALGALTVVAENDNDSTLEPITRSKVSFDAVSGQTYRIAVGGNSYYSDIGDITLNWTLFAVPDYAAVLGAPAGMTFTPGGDKPWIDGGTVSGKAAVKSGLEETENSQSSVLTATFSGAGKLSFSYMVSSEGNYDWLIVEVDGEQVVKTSGYSITSWTKYEKALAAGDHTVVWTYSKDSSGARGEDCAWISEVRFGASSDFSAWASANGISGAWNDKDAKGIYNVFRYAFNKPTGAFTTPPMLDITFNAVGKAVVKTPPLVNSAGFAFTIEAADNVGGTGNVASYPLNASGETAIDETDKVQRFFRLRAVEQ